jgi:hypothetical protein
MPNLTYSLVIALGQPFVQMACGFFATHPETLHPFFHCLIDFLSVKT